MTYRSQTVDTPDGPFTIIESADGVIASGWTADLRTVAARIPLAVRPDSVESGPVASASAVEAYYSGELDAIDSVPVAQQGGPFRSAAWIALRSIPPGSPLTYTQFAELVGSPRAVRAAASACATNAPALFVPCHRVLRTDGTLGGFAWGLEVKRSLLAREGTVT